MKDPTAVLMFRKASGVIARLIRPYIRDVCLLSLWLYTASLLFARLWYYISEATNYYFWRAKLEIWIFCSLAIKIAKISKNQWTNANCWLLLYIIPDYFSLHLLFSTMPIIYILWYYTNITKLNRLTLTFYLS